jgi:hypothetical protein
MSAPLDQIEAATTLVTWIQQANNDDGMSPIHMLGTTIAGADSPAEIRARQQHHREALLALAAAARTLITIIEGEEARWTQSDEEHSRKAAKRQLEKI